jgi:hypothetical protein
LKPSVNALKNAGAVTTCAMSMSPRAEQRNDGRGGLVDRRYDDVEMLLGEIALSAARKIGRLL